MDSLFWRGVLTLLPSSLLTAQIVTATVTASTLMQGNAAVANGPPGSSSWPAGAGPALHLRAVSSAAGAEALAVANASVQSAFAIQNDNSGLALASSQVVVVQGGNGSAAVGPGDLVFTVSSTLPVASRIEVQWTMLSTAGAPLPLVEVDIDNDGTLEYQGRSPNSTATIAHRTLSAPLAIRVRMQTSTTTGSVVSAVNVRVLPDAGLTVTPVSTRCGSSIDLSVRPSFDDQLLFDLLPEPGMVDALRFLVLGTGVAPRPLPTPAPCFLWPTIDAVGLIPQVPYTYRVVLPLRGLHPLLIHAQALQLGSALVASPALTIQLP